MYPQPTENRPLLFGLDDNEFVNACVFMAHYITQGRNEQARDLMGKIHTIITNNPAVLGDVKNFESVAIATCMMGDCVAQNTIEAAQLKRDLYCMAYYCYSKHMMYYECAREAIEMRVGLMMSNRVHFAAIVRSLLSIKGSINDEKKQIETCINKMNFADLSYLNSENALDEEERIQYNRMKSIFAGLNAQTIIQEGDALHKHMLDSLGKLYLEMNEFSYLSLE